MHFSDINLKNKPVGAKWTTPTLLKSILITEKGGENIPQPETIHLYAY
jgi:hypothetical protein